MGLFSRSKKISGTQEVETLRAVFQENYEVYCKVEKSEDLKRFRELEEYVNSPLFKTRKRDIEQLSYKPSEYYKAEQQYKTLFRSRKLRAFYLIKGSQELTGYLKVKETELYSEFQKLRIIVKSSGFDKRLHVDEYVKYKKILADPKIKAAVSFEKNRKFRDYTEICGTKLPAEFDRLKGFIQSEEFKSNRAYLLNKKRYLTTDDYKLWCEHEALRKRPDISRYYVLCKDPFFNNMRRWELAFSDDFTTGRLDESKWITRYYAGERFLNDTYGVGNDVQLFTGDNLSYHDSAACLNFRKEPIIGKYWDNTFGIKEKKYDYTSAMLSTACSFKQRYGRFEAKIKLSRSPVQQCFWMMGDTDVPHVNIMKSCADGVSVGHTYPCHGKLAGTLQRLEDIKLANDYYIFTLEWTEEKMVWMVNDFVIKEVRENIPDVPMYIILSLGASDVPADKYLPVRMEIDWVRLYKMKN